MLESAKYKLIIVFVTKHNFPKLRNCDKLHNNFETTSELSLGVGTGMSLLAVGWLVGWFGV